MSRLSGEEHLPSKPMLLFPHLVIRIKFNLTPRVLSYLSPLTLWDKWKNTLGARLEYVLSANMHTRYKRPKERSVTVGNSQCKPYCTIIRVDSIEMNFS